MLKVKKPLIGGLLIWLAAGLGFAAYGGATDDNNNESKCGTWEKVSCDFSLKEHEEAIAAANAKHEADVAALIQAAHDNQVRVYLETVAFIQAAEYAAAVEAAVEAAHEAEHAAAAKAAPRSASGGGVGGACGGSKYDAVIPEESGGNPNARNPSGAWGCYQIMPRTWAGSCSDLGQHGSASVEAQAQCADRLPGDSWVASGNNF